MIRSCYCAAGWVTGADKGRYLPLVSGVAANVARVPSLVASVPAVVSTGAPTGPLWTDVASAWAAITAAFFALATFVVAVVAASYAKGQVAGARAQLGQARELAEEQARPYVVIYTRTRDEISPHLVDLVIENLGVTGARDVTITAIPPLTRSEPGATAGSGGEAVALPAAVPFLAPRQRWQTYWDSGLQRKDSGLPDRFAVTISYRDSRAAQHSEVFVLDWNTYIGRMWPTEKTVHHAAVALGEVAGTLSAWANRDDVVRVATYDGEDLDRRQARESARRHREHQELLRRVLPAAEPRPDLTAASLPEPSAGPTPESSQVPTAPAPASRPAEAQNQDGKQG